MTRSPRSRRPAGPGGGRRGRWQPPPQQRRQRRRQGMGLLALFLLGMLLLLLVQEGRAMADVGGVRTAGTSSPPPSVPAAWMDDCRSVRVVLGRARFCFGARPGPSRRGRLPKPFHPLRHSSCMHWRMAGSRATMRHRSSAAACGLAPSLTNHSSSRGSRRPPRPSCAEGAVASHRRHGRSKSTKSSSTIPTPTSPSSVPGTLAAVAGRVGMWGRWAPRGSTRPSRCVKPKRCRGLWIPK